MSSIHPRAFAPVSTASRLSGFIAGFPQEDILDHCCFAWNKLINMPWKVMSIGTREWAFPS
jgi:hypothetical protein